LSSLSLEQWLAEFDRLEKTEAEFMKTAKTPPGKRKQPQRSSSAASQLSCSSITVRMLASARAIGVR
jgi:hypothetical protein